SPDAVGSARLGKITSTAKEAQRRVASPPRGPGKGGGVGRSLRHLCPCWRCPSCQRGGPGEPHPTRNCPRWTDPPAGAGTGSQLGHLWSPGSSSQSQGSGTVVSLCQLSLPPLPPSPLWRHLSFAPCAPPVPRPSGGVHSPPPDSPPAPSATLARTSLPSPPVQVASPPAPDSCYRWSQSPPSRPCAGR
ncbi:hypothetical protein Taro_006720, partial [Colocasia esculenta]|nr:hypothetical protein [Colocasia esculenta]